MVAQITEGTAFDKHGRPFRRRNYLPGILLFVALAVVTLMVWVIALNRPPDVHEAAVCNPPPPAADPSTPAPQLGEQVTRADMTDVTPAKLADTKIRVLNASGQGGQAAEVAGALRDLGFAEPSRGQRHRVRDRRGWSARARSGSARPGAPPPRRSGWSRRAPSCSRTSAATTPSTWRSAPSSPS